LITNKLESMFHKGIPMLLEDREIGVTRSREEQDMTENNWGVNENLGVERHHEGVGGG
jgi:hypothetical protein